MYQGFTQHKTGELVYLTGDTIPLRHAFTTRLGGVSQGELAALNLRSAAASGAGRNHSG